MTEEQKKLDFEARKKAAIDAMDAVLKAHDIGIRLVLADWPAQIRPAIQYVDQKNYEEGNRKDRRTKAKRSK